MKVYLAAPYGARETIRGLAEEITRIGFTVTASWLQETHEINDGTQGAAVALDPAQVAVHAATDLRDIDNSDLLVLFTAANVGVEGGGGRHVETGYAIAKGLPVLVVGEPENVFHRLPAKALSVPDWHEAVIELSSRLVASKADQPRHGGHPA
jgi:nucleoside 2-deoxyribosyltransferase